MMVVTQKHQDDYRFDCGKERFYTLLALIALSVAQSFVQTHIHNSILVIDSSNNALYDHVHWLIGLSYLSIKATNVYVRNHDWKERN